ncbi:MAG: AI-2E family transporter [Gammaproteobacteria bacterium]|jgi:putative permease
MFEVVQSWYKRYFTDPQASLLVVLLIVSFVIMYFMGGMLAPFFAAIIIAYMLEGSISTLETKNIPRILAVNMVFILFVTFLAFLVVVLLPIISRQASQFFQDLPGMVNDGQALLMKLPQQYPEFITEESVNQVIVASTTAISAMGQSILSFTLASVPVIISVLVYLVLVPLMVFLLLKDKTDIIGWMFRFLSTDRHLINSLWQEMDAQIGNYIRGKVYEIIIIYLASYLLFKILGLNYASLLAIIVGLSVLIPYIGAAVVTVPVALVGYFQWGFDPTFIWLMAGYGVLQFLDGNVLVPVLFSDVVNLHPLAIIVSILVFGGLWGFWGIFFAIPLATLVKALIYAWPTKSMETA